MKNIIGIVIALLFLVLLLFLSSKFKNKENSRKFVHIGVCHLWIIATFFFDNVYAASALPFLFIIVNYISYKKKLFSSIERDDKGLGTVYYPLSIFVLMILSYLYFGRMLYGGIGVLIMGYGDGFASLIGQKFKSPVLVNNKTVFGTLAMFIISFIVLTVFSLSYNCFSLITILIIALIASIVELFSPNGVDNLTVPFITSFVAFWML